MSPCPPISHYLNASLWEEDGRMISLSGNLPAADLLAIAERMQTVMD